MTDSVFIGIDGGGSKTAGVVMDGQGAVLARCRAEGSSIIGAPSPRACEVLAGVKARLCAEAGISPGDVAGLGLGLNGIDHADEIPQQHAALASCLDLPAARLTLVNDGIVALWGASPARASVIVHHGSGITNAYRGDYGQEQLFDHLNVGVMFDIRNALPALVARMLDGRAPATPLRDAVLRHLDIRADAYADALFRGRLPWERLRTAPDLVFAAWRTGGDPAADRLVEQALDDYACAAGTMIRRTQAARCHVAFGGGVLDHAPDALITALATRIRADYPGAVVTRPQLPPAVGAAIMAANAHGLDPAALYAALAGKGITV